MFAVFVSDRRHAVLSSRESVTLRCRTEKEIGVWVVLQRFLNFAGREEPIWGLELSAVVL